MSRFLLLDIGAGTLDVLYYDEEAGVHYKAVVKSPVLYLAELAANLPGNLLITGTEMGGGRISKILRERTHQAAVVMSVSAAYTVHHDLERVRSWGIEVVEDEQVEELSRRGTHRRLNISDLELARLTQIVAGFGVPFEFDVVGICAQDHGMPPPGMSHLDYRHQVFKEFLDGNPFPSSLLYSQDEIPPTFNRLSSIAKTARELPAKEVYLLDSGMAAILGAAMDERAKEKEKLLVLDVATSHTLGAALEGGEIAGFFEYHTSDITLELLERLLFELAEGSLDHDRILREGGHGAYVRKAFGFAAAEIIVATGPKRRLLEKSGLPVVFGAPLGDNMMTGTVGMLEAIRRRKGLGPIRYF